MKELDVFRYLKKYRRAIAGLSILVGIGFYVIAKFYIQQYTAVTVIEYTGADAEEGKSPDGTPLEPSEIYGANLISQAMKKLGIEYTEATIDGIRMNIQVELIITDEDLLVQQAKLDNGEEDYEFIPTRFIVTFNCGVENGKEYPRKVLNQILQEYAAYYGKMHVNTSQAANPVSDIATKGYDYLEMAEVMDDMLEDIDEHLADKAEWNADFRSSRTGRSFQDLKNEFEFIRDVEVRQLLSEILEGKITKNRDLLLNKYQNRNNELDISNSAVSFEVDRIRGVISSYENAMDEFSAAADITNENDNDTNEGALRNYVLPNVYDDWNRKTEDDEWEPVDRTAEYDQLMMKYIEDRTFYEENLIDREYNDYILSVFADAPASASEEVQVQTLEKIERLAEKINELQAVYYETNDEYNEYLGGKNIAVLSSVRVTDRFPIMIFTILIIVVFGALGCAGAALFGRIEDFIEYYAFTNKVDGLPNRAKCDQFINSRNRRPIPDSFACIVFKMANLQSENARLGRESGDRMIKDFAATLTAVFSPSNKMFVGNNGAGQYLIFAEALDRDQVYASLRQVHTVLKEKAHDCGYHIELQSGFACAGNEQCYNIRELLSTAIKRVGTAHTEKRA